MKLVEFLRSLGRRRFASGGMVPASRPGDDEIRIWARGACPLDGYPLIETEPCPPLIEGGFEHMIPNAEIPTYGQALAHIAEAHSVEVLATAEEITRGA